ncbi:hypothetical protein [Pseudomonas paralactis]|uniref:hypothetical protein n=1 Tax=Pseudomonas paralactis TaxID=1615673 RepID=UPI0034D3946F
MLIETPEISDTPSPRQHVEASAKGPAGAHWQSTSYSCKASPPGLNTQTHYVPGHETPPNKATAAQRIESNLKSLTANMTRHKEMLLEKFVKLDERLRELEQREHALAIRELCVARREDELLAGIDALDAAQAQLNAMLKNA